MQWIKHLGVNVSKRRKELGYNRETLAVKAGVSIDTIRRIEEGRAQNLTLATIEGLGLAFQEKDPFKLLKKNYKPAN